ncbi:MAG TPA: DUF4198 domain-containing protein [Gemmatimonadaceae bacterium]|nr:DUF4198 domain-containing protein [Gemmatimonadaceae bacterium]
MRGRTPIVVAVTTATTIALAVVVGEAHDLFLKPRDFVVRPGAEVQVRVLNGTFTSSEAPVASNRLRDLTVAGPAGITHPERATWADSAKESRWRVTLREPGTHVLGASLDPKTIKLGGTEFNGYLREEGLPDILAARKTARQLGDSAHERYAKHVKALVRVYASGAAKSARADTAYRIVLGYPAELVPLDDPYVLRSGGTLRVRAMADGRPLIGQVVQAGGRTSSGARIIQREVRTDSAGVARFRMSTRGTWYVKFIHMRQVPRSEGDSVTHESKWATLTFARP